MHRPKYCVCIKAWCKDMLKTSVQLFWTLQLVSKTVGGNDWALKKSWAIFVSCSFRFTSSVGSNGLEQEPEIIERLQHPKSCSVFISRRALWQDVIQRLCCQHTKSIHVTKWETLPLLRDKPRYPYFSCYLTAERLTDCLSVFVASALFLSFSYFPLLCHRVKSVSSCFDWNMSCLWTVGACF